MDFYLGTNEPAWLERTTVPLFVSRRRLQRRVSFPKAIGTWALDSGGFTELSTYGAWMLPADEYAGMVQTYQREIGGMVFAAQQDWMCEPSMLERTGLTAWDHIERTVANSLELSQLAPDVPWMRALQGYTIEHYRFCWDLYAQSGIDLTQERIVGLGSVCRRQATSEIGELVSEFTGRGVAVHGFGVKTHGLTRYGDMLASADSTAWSLDAYRRGAPMFGHSHQTCSSCMDYALWWRQRMLTKLGGAPALW